MSPQNRPHSHPDPLAMPPYAPCSARAAALDLLRDFAFPDSFSIEAWLDRIESRNGREMRP
jgi:hypothetical protein